MARKPADTHYTVFPTAWGPLGAVAGDRGITRVVLPHYNLDDLEALLQWEHPGAKRDESAFADFIQAARDYFNARPAEFSAVGVDLPAESSFAGKVYRAARAIPRGSTLSYSQHARQIARPDAARAVATTLSKNPTPLLVPCHRVIYADGRPGGFSSPAGPAQKQRLLNLEQASG
jgi:methylated-DNA-[protein]-cysteine S-methyltransferase